MGSVAVGVILNIAVVAGLHVCCLGVVVLRLLVVGIARKRMCDVANVVGVGCSCCNGGYVCWHGCICWRYWLDCWSARCFGSAGFLTAIK